MNIAPKMPNQLDSKRLFHAFGITWLLGLILATSAWPMEPLGMLGEVDVAPSPSQVIHLSQHAFLLEDRRQALTVETIDGVPDSHWRHVSEEALHVAYTRTTWWIRVPLINSDDHLAQRILEVRSPLIDFLDVYLIQGHQPVQKYAVGDQRPLAGRPILGRTFAFPIEIPAHTTREILIRLSLKDGVFDVAPLLLWPEKAFSQMQYREQLLLGIFFGSILALTIYNLLLFFTSHDRNFLRYAMLLGVLALWNFGYRGLGYLYLWPNHPSINNLLGMVFPSLMLVLASGFVTNFLDTRKRTPRIHRWIVWVTSTLSIPAAVMGADMLGLDVGIVSAFYGLLLQMLLLTLAYLGAGIVIYRQGFTPAVFFLLAWFCLAVGVWIYLISTLGNEVIPVSIWTENAVAIGSMFEFHLLALGLGYRYRLLRDQNTLLEGAASQTQLRQNFLDTIAHELRTPLTVIQTTTENLSFQTTEPDGLRRYEKILRATDRMSGIISGYLDESGAGVTRDQNVFEACQPRKLLEDAAGAAWVHLHDHGITIDVSEKTRMFVCDRRLTTLALRNLVDNALKYSPKASTILLRGGSSVRGLWFEVENQGCVMTQEQLERIFEPGYRVSSETTGSGYGLTLARRVIEQQGGTLLGKLLDGGRCQFRIDLPHRTGV